MFKVTKQITREDMRDILTTAFEAGSYGSVVIVGYGVHAPRDPDSLCSGRNWPRYSTDPLNGGSVKVEDRYGDGESGEITQATLQAGLDYLGQHHPRMLAALVDGSYDVIPADALIQAAAFGSVIYG